MTLRLPALLLLLLCAACASAPREAPVLCVASDLDNPPFAGVDGAGVAYGHDVELMTELARRIGRRLVWERMPFGELLPAVEAGEVDAVCATLGITPERSERVGFTRPYFRTAIAVVVRTGPGEPTSMAELAGLRVSGAQGTTAARAVLTHLPDALAVTSGPKDSPTRERLLSAAIDAAVMDGPAADALVAGADGRLARLPRALDAENYGIALPKKRRDLLIELDHALGELERTGWLAKLDARHGLEPSGERN